MVTVVLSGLLGAAIFAIALLAYWVRRNRADINRLHAEVTATKIAALTQLSTVPAQEESPEPVRRKRHLALYIGGGVAAVFASLGERARSLSRRSRIAVGTAVVVAAASTAAALLSTSDTAPQDEATRWPATADKAPDSDTPSKDHAAPPTKPINGPTPGSGQGDMRPDSSRTGAVPTPAAAAADTAKASRAATPNPAPRDDEGEKPQPPKHSAPPAGQTPTPSPSGPAPTSPPVPTPVPTPSLPGGDSGRPCVGVPPLLDLCLGR
ncbi:hypothetical protein [Streptomyces sp. NPDC006334]|uniref:hypothetical protein n=1 Tax=Streptomyces sp. NPDC006334 TaxID=3156754 RepID=UPI0033A16BA1